MKYLFYLFSCEFSPKLAYNLEKPFVCSAALYETALNEYFTCILSNFLVFSLQLVPGRVH